MLMLRLNSLQRISLPCQTNSNQTNQICLPKITMEKSIGLLRVHINRGINLAIRDMRSSDPYVIVRMGKQKLKTKVIKKNVNPEWNEDLTLSVTDPNLPITLNVYDKDLFTDDKMGDADFEIKSFVEAVKLHKQGDFPNGTVIMKLKPTRQNCLSEESYVVLADNRVVQNMILRLRNVESGEVELQLQWIDVPKS